MKISYQSDVGAIKRLVLKHAREAFISEDAIARQWRELNYLGPPDFARAVEEYERFVEILTGFGIEIDLLPANERVGLDSIYVRDASIVCDKGIILCNMGKAARRNEPTAQEATFRKPGTPIHGAIRGDGRLEGGDVVWLDERTVAIGRGYRTNDEGIRQFRDLLADSINDLIVAPLPHWRGPNDVFHLMSMISPIDHHLALVYSPLLPVPFRETLLHRGFELIDIPDSEFKSMGCNVLAVAPRVCVMLAGNPQTRQRLECAGIQVFEYEGAEISAKGCGGPTCLTRPIGREL